MPRSSIKHEHSIIEREYWAHAMAQAHWRGPRRTSTEIERSSRLVYKIIGTMPRTKRNGA